MAEQTSSLQKGTAHAKDLDQVVTEDKKMGTFSKEEEIKRISST